MNAASTGLVLKPETNAVAFLPPPSPRTIRRGGHGAMMLEQDLGVFLLASTQGAADGIEPEQFRSLNRFGREMLVFQRAGPLCDDV